MSRSRTPLVTFAIPTLNRSSFLRRAIDSCLAQTLANIEVVVSDDASTDNTQAMLRRYSDPRVRLTSNAQTIGMSPNWNRCLHLASGTYFTLLGDDDYLEPSFAKTMVEVFENSADVSFVYSKVLVHDRDKIFAYRPAPKFQSTIEFLRAFFSGRVMPHLCGILFRRSDLLSLGGFNETLRFAPDVEAWIQIATIGKIAYVDDALSHFTLHASSASHTLPLKETLKEREYVFSIPFQRWPERFEPLRQAAIRHQARLASRDLFRQATLGQDKLSLASFVKNHLSTFMSLPLYAFPIILCSLLFPTPMLSGILSISRHFRPIYDTIQNNRRNQLQVGSLLGSR